MRKKMLKSVGVLCLSVVLCMGMAGCSEKENMQPTSADAHTTNENGNNEDIETSGESVGNLEEDNAEEPEVTMRWEATVKQKQIAMNRACFMTVQI